MALTAGKRDETTDFEWFMMEFHRIEGCERTKARIMELIKAQAGKVIRFNYRDLTRPYQVERARQLLDAGNDRPTTRNRLMSEFGCSKRKAYMLIEDALRRIPETDHGQRHPQEGHQRVAAGRARRGTSSHDASA